MSKARDIASAIPAPSTVSSAELGYLDGVTSAIQTQLDAKTAKSTLSTTGDIYYASAANTPARLGIGSSAQVLTVASGVPSWATPAGGATFSGARLTKSANQSLASGTWTTITFNTEAFDVDGYHDNSTNTSRLTIPTGKSGYFLICGQAEFPGGSTADRARQVALQKNGVDLQLTQFPNSGTTYTDARVFTAIINAVATDYFEIQCRQDSGGSLNVNGGLESTNFCITYLGA